MPTGEPPIGGGELASRYQSDVVFGFSDNSINLFEKNLLGQMDVLRRGFDMRPRVPRQINYTPVSTAIQSSGPSQIAQASGGLISPSLFGATSGTAPTALGGNFPITFQFPTLPAVPGNLPAPTLLPWPQMGSFPPGSATPPAPPINPINPIPNPPPPPIPEPGSGSGSASGSGSTVPSGSANPTFNCNTGCVPPNDGNNYPIINDTNTLEECMFNFKCAPTVTDSQGAVHVLCNCVHYEVSCQAEFQPPIGNPYLGARIGTSVICCYLGFGKTDPIGDGDMEACCEALVDANPQYIPGSCPTGVAP